MGILQDALPGLKRFLGSAELKASVLALVIRGVVFSTKRKPRKTGAAEVEKIRMPNDPNLKPAEVVERYDLRGQMERFFKELKSTLGLHPYRSSRGTPGDS